MAHVRKQQVQQELAGFPLLTTSELCDCLIALGVGVQSEDLTKPTPASTQMIYQQLVENIMGAPLEVIEGPKATLMGMMEYKDLYSDALHFTMFYTHCARLAHICGVNSFSMADLTRPDSQRLRTVLSGIMNFAKFREGRSHFHMMLQQKVQKQVEKTERLKKELEKIEANIEEIAARNAADRPVMEEKKKINDELKDELLGLRAKQCAVSADVDEAKKTRTELLEQTTSKTQETAQLQMQAHAARSRLVQSPDRIKKQISEMSNAVSVEKGTLASWQRKGRELGNRLEVFAGLETDLKGLIDLEKGVDDQRSKIDEVKRASSALEAKLEQKKIETQNFNAKLEQADRQLQQVKDRMARETERGDKSSQNTKIRLENLKVEYAAKWKERGSWQKQRVLLEDQQKILEAEMNAFLSKHEVELNGLLDEYWTMRKQAEDYMNTMTAELGLKTIRA